MKYNGMHAMSANHALGNRSVSDGWKSIMRLIFALGNFSDKARGHSDRADVSLFATV